MPSRAFPTARSGWPSRLRSPTAKDCGWTPAAQVCGGANVQAGLTAESRAESGPLPAILLHPPSANERTSKGDRPHDAGRKAIVKAIQVRMTDVAMDPRRMAAADHRQPSGCSRVSFALGDGASSRVKSTCFYAMPKGIVRGRLTSADVSRSVFLEGSGMDQTY